MNFAVSRVVISVSKYNKHTLPVDPSCAWWHPNKISSVRDNSVACNTVAGRPVGNYSDVLGCMQEAHCELKGTLAKFKSQSTIERKTHAQVDLTNCVHRLTSAHTANTHPPSRTAHTHR